MRSEFAKTQAQVAAFNKELAATVGPKGAVNPQGWRDATAAVQGYSQAFRDGLNSTGMWEASQLRLSAAADTYTKKLHQQKITFRDMYKEQGRTYKQAYREQLKLQRAFAQELPGRDSAGRKMYDVGVPTEVHKDWDTLNNRVGFFRENVRSASIQLTNWGKNTQWAGRQLSMGFTMPLLAFGAAAGTMAYQVDQQMVRIQKVYDTTANAASTSLKDMIAVESEYAQLRQDAWATAESATRNYASAATDTLEVQAELAAQGKKGAELQEATNQIMRIATLGEFEAAEATKTLTALTSIMGLTAKEAGDQFNYMNAIENATSLATQDFAKAIPIALGPLKEMGGDVQDLAMLLVAMKERGIEAGEGANAIKSMMQRLYRPSKAIREEWQELAGIDLMGMVKGANGDVMKMLPAIQDAVRDLGRADRVQLLGGLFGTYQVARQNAILNGLEDMQNEIGQTARVLEVDKQGWEGWSETADREMKKIQESASFRFKEAVNSIKNQLAEMGPAFLDVATDVLKVIHGIIEGLRGLPEPIKDFAKYAAIFMAIVGPLTMLVGLSANFTGTMGRMAMSVLGLGRNFTLLNTESVATGLAQTLAERGMLSAGQAASLTAINVQKLTEAYEKANIASEPVEADSIQRSQLLRDEAIKADKLAREYQELANARLMGNQVPGNLTGGPVGNMQQQANSYRAKALSKNAEADVELEKEKAAAAARTASSTDETADNLGRGAKFGRIMAASGTAFAAASMATLFTTNETVAEWSKLAMILSVAGPAVWGIASAMAGLPKLIAIVTTKITLMVAAARTATMGTAAAMAMHTTMAGQLGVLLPRAASILRAMLTPTLAIGAALAAAGAAAWWMKGRIEEGRDEIQHMYQDADKLAEIIGYTAQDHLTRSFDKAGNSVVSLSSKVRQFKDEYADVVTHIQTAESEQEALRRAMTQGMKVIDTGGTAEQAREATEIALAAATSVAEAKEIMIKFKGMVDFSDVEVQINQLLSTGEGLLGGIGEVEGRGWWQQFTFADTDAINKIKEAGDQAGRAYAGAYDRAIDAGISTKRIEDKAQQQLDVINEQIKSARAGLDDSAFTTADDEKLSALIEVRERFMAQFLAGVPGVEKYIGEMDEGVSIIEALLWAQMDVSEENQKIANTNPFGSFYQTGLTKAQRELLKVGDNTDAAGDSTEKLTKKQEAAKAAAERLALTAQKIKSAYAEIDFDATWKDIITNVQSELGDIAADNFQNSMDASMEAYSETQQARLDSLTDAHEAASEALQTRQENATEAFEDQWEARRKAVAKAYDDRIKKINREIDADERANEVRERIFEAEMTRIQRLNSVENTTVEFNLALDEGNLDEAAKIRNDMQAEAEQWAMEDAESRADRRAAREKKRMEKQVKRLENLRDRRLDALADIEEAERESMERMQDRQSKALEDRQEAQQKALQTEVDNNIAAQQEIWDNRKENVDKAIALFKAFVPRNEKELRAHVARIEDKYGDFNVATKGKFNKTSVDIGNMLRDETKLAAQSIKSDIAWETIGQTASKRMMMGALGMKWSQFKKWMETGIWPEGATGPSKTSTTGAGSSAQNDRGAEQVAPKRSSTGDARHTGGWVNSSPGSRKGVARTAPIQPNERQMLLKNGEFVVNEHAAKTHAAALEAINSGRGVGGKGGPGSPGMAGIMGGALAGTIGAGIYAGMAGAHNQKVDEYRARKVAQSDFASSAGTKRYAPGPGGTHRASEPGKGWTNSHDYGNELGSPIYAIDDGRIIHSADIRSGGSGEHDNAYPKGYSSYGVNLILRTKSGVDMLAAHLMPGTRAPLGKIVKGGEQIAESASTGNSSGPHTHFEINGMEIAREWFDAHGIGLRTGGYTKSEGLAKLHKDEVVIDKDRTSKLFKGIDAFTEMMMMNGFTMQQINDLYKDAKKRAEDNKSSGRTPTDPGSQAGPGYSSGEGNLRAGTYNVFWRSALNSTAPDIQRLMAQTDVLGLQEVYNNREALVSKAFREKGWAHTPMKRDSVLGWNSEKFKALKAGVTGLNPGMTGGGRNSVNRSAAYALLQNRESGGKFWALSTHLQPFASTSPRLRAIQNHQFETLSKMYQRMSGSAPVVMLGDFNNAMMGKNLVPGMTSNWEGGRTKGFDGTGHRGNWVDHILFGEGIEIVGNKIVSKGMESDHHAIISNLNIPSLAKGARNVRWDNTLANLHKGEGVLTEDMNNQMKQGMKNFANGGNSTYNVNVNVTNPNASADDIANTVLTRLQWQENRKPRSR